MIETQTLKGNLIKQEHSLAFTLNQYDKNISYKINLIGVNGNGYTLDSSDVVTIEWQKPNGQPFLQTSNIVKGDNYITLLIPEAISQIAGTGSYNIIITNGDTRKGTIKREYSVISNSMRSGTSSEDMITDVVTELRELSATLTETVQNNQELINNNTVATKQDIANVNSSLEEKVNKTSLLKNLVLDNPKTENVIHFMGGIDSLTAGANGRYSDYLNEILKGKYGACGIGYVALMKEKDSTITDIADSITHSGLNFIRDITPFGDGIAQYSLNNYGIYKDNADGTEYYKINVNREKWTKCRVIFLKQSNGGTFNIGYKGCTPITVDTSNSGFDLGYIEVGDRPKGVDYNQIEITNIQGNVCIYALFLHGESGFIFSNVSKVGETLTDLSNLNSTFREKWIDILKPDLYIFNGGTNDTSIPIDETQYNTVLNSWLSPFTKKEIPMILTRPNPLSYQPLNELWDKFETKLIDYAEKNRCCFVSNYELLGGSYENAVNQGYMQNTDGTHPYPNGYKKIANNYLNILNISSLNFEKWSYWTWILNGGESPDTNKITGGVTNLSDVLLQNVGTTATLIKKLSINQSNTGIIIEFNMYSKVEWEETIEKNKVSITIGCHDGTTGSLSVGTITIDTNLTTAKNEISVSIDSGTDYNRAISIFVKNNYGLDRYVTVTDFKAITPLYPRYIPFVDEI